MKHEMDNFDGRTFAFMVICNMLIGRENSNQQQNDEKHFNLLLSA